MKKKLSKKTSFILVGIVIGLFVGVSINQAFGGTDPTIVDQRNGNLAVNIANVYQNGLLVPYGNVGIGVVNPAVKLDVNGYVKSTTAFCIGNTCIDESQLKTILSVGGIATTTPVTTSTTSTTTSTTASTTASTHKLPPTGITAYGDLTTTSADASVAADTGAFPRQDARYARPFDYTKIANDGSTLPAIATLGTGAKDWACTKDNITGLVWEVKTTSGLRNKDNTYTWYNSDTATNGGDAGTVSGGTCATTGRCDTEKFAADVNGVGLCGHGSDWRLPTVKELEQLSDFSQLDPAIDTSYFPNTVTTSVKSFYWTSTLDAVSNLYAWIVDGYTGISMSQVRYVSQPVRLVWTGSAAPNVHDVTCRDTNPIASNPDNVYDTATVSGTAIDTRSGLMWQRCNVGQTWNGSTCTGSAQDGPWAWTLQQSVSNKFAGFTDWRVPNVKELRSLVEECRSFPVPSINVRIFPNTPMDIFYTSSPSKLSLGGDTPLTWVVDFGKGAENYLQRYSGVYVRLVRDVTP